MAGYSIRMRMVDGNETLRFTDLGQAARYLKARDLGADYRRPGVLQAEYGYYTFDGFGWSDILDGSPFDDRSQYKASLINDVRLSCRKANSKLGPGSGWLLKDGPETVGIIDHFPLDAADPKPFRPICTGGCRNSGPKTDTMRAARDWLKAAYLAAVRVEERTPVLATNDTRNEYD